MHALRLSRLHHIHCAPLLQCSAIFDGYLDDLLSFDELPIALFLSGTLQETLPARMWSSLNDEIDPTIAVVSTLLIVVTAAGCGAALKEYGHLLHDDPVYADRAAAFSGRVRDATELLTELPAFQAPTEPVPLKVTYQEPCHLAHAQRIGRQPRQLLAAVPELELAEMRESSLCCGSAGIYNILRPRMANDLGDRKAGNAAATDAEVLVTANPGCAMQMVASLRRNGVELEVRHIIDVLDESYGGEAAGRSGRWACDQGTSPVHQTQA